MIDHPLGIVYDLLGMIYHLLGIIYDLLGMIYNPLGMIYHCLGRNLLGASQLNKISMRKNVKAILWRAGIKQGIFDGVAYFSRLVLALDFVEA